MKRTIAIALTAIMLSSCASSRRSKCWCPQKKNHAAKVIIVGAIVATTLGILFFNSQNKRSN